MRRGGTFLGLPLRVACQPHFTALYSVIGRKITRADESAAGRTRRPEPWRRRSHVRRNLEQASSSIGNGGALFCLLITSITGWRFTIIVLFHRHVLPQSKPILLILLGFPGDHERLEPDRIWPASCACILLANSQVLPARFTSDALEPNCCGCATLRVQHIDSASPSLQFSCCFLLSSTPASGSTPTFGGATYVELMIVALQVDFR
jgi:hypothetical protein